MRCFRESMQNTMSLCQYNVRAFTHPEIDALEEYDDQVPLPAYFDLETLLADTDDPAGAALGLGGRRRRPPRSHDQSQLLCTVGQG